MRSLLAAALVAALPTAPAAAPAAVAPVSASAPASGAPALAPAELLAKIAAAHGGQKALAKLHAVRERGTLASPRGAAVVTRDYERPGRLRVDIAYAASREVRLLDGEKGFRNGEPVTGPSLAAMALQAARLDLPFLLAGAAGKAQDLGLIEHRGRQVRALRLALGEGKEAVALIDPVTSRIVRSETSVPAGPGRIAFSTDYSDYRMVDGLLFAFAEENFANGMATGKTTLEKIELNPALPAATWSPKP